MNDNGPIYSALNGKDTPATTSGFSIFRLNNQRAISWSSTSSSVTFSFSGNQDVYGRFVLSGSTTFSASPTYDFWNGLYSATNLGGGTLDKDGSYYYNTYNLNAGEYYLRTGTTRTFTFSNPVLVSAGINRSYPTLTGSGASRTAVWPQVSECTNVEPAIVASINGLVTSWRIFSNTNTTNQDDNRLYFTVPAGSSRQVTFSATGNNYTYRPVRSESLNGNTGWSLDKYAGYSDPWTAASNNVNNSDYWNNKTLTLNPGIYWIAIGAGNYAGYSGTITIQ